MHAQPEETENTWKMGVFYYNRADKRLLVPKRSGLGWTFNFAHWLSYLFMALILGGAVAVCVVAGREKK